MGLNFIIWRSFEEVSVKRTVEMLLNFFGKLILIAWIMCRLPGLNKRSLSDWCTRKQDKKLLVLFPLV